MPMPMFVSMHAVAIRAQNIAFGYLAPKTMKCNFRVLANVKKFFAPDMVKIQRRRVRVVAANSATAVNFYLVN